jgi:hypothetical protein
MNLYAFGDLHPNELTSFLSYNSPPLNSLSHMTVFYSYIIGLRLNHTYNPNSSPRDAVACIMKKVSKDFIMTIAITGTIIPMNTNLLSIRYHPAHSLPFAS